MVSTEHYEIEYNVNQVPRLAHSPYCPQSSQFHSHAQILVNGQKLLLNLSDGIFLFPHNFLVDFLADFMLCVSIITES